MNPKNHSLITLLSVLLFCFVSLISCKSFFNGGQGEKNSAPTSHDHPFSKIDHTHPYAPKTHTHTSDQIIGSSGAADTDISSVNNKVTSTSWSNLEYINVEAPSSGYIIVFANLVAWCMCPPKGIFEINVDIHRETDESSYARQEARLKNDDDGPIEYRIPISANGHFKVNKGIHKFLLVAKKGNKACDCWAAHIRMTAIFVPNNYRKLY